MRNEIDQLIERIPAEFNRFYFDIGAHDGRTVSNTYHLDYELKWCGILVEPVVHLHFLSKSIRSQHRNIFVNAACVGPNFSSRTIRLLYCNLMTIAPEISNYNSEKWVSGGQTFLAANEEILEIWAPASTANQILCKFSAPHKIGLLSIDVEGSETEVLKGIDFEIFQFAIVVIETADKSKAQSILKNNGYKFHKRIGQNKIYLNPIFEKLGEI